MGQCQQNTQEVSNKPRLQPAKGQFYYQGSIDSFGLPHGKGKKYFDDDSVFEGIFQRGDPIEGKFEYANGKTYQGKLKESHPNGFGIMKDENGTFQGQFSKGFFIQGKVYYKDKSFYEGSMQENMKHGENCTYKYPDGDIYVGSFNKNEFKQGTYTTNNGVEYQGQYANNNKKNGKGKLILKGVSQYEGQFLNDLYHGQGKLTLVKKNIIYQGTFFEGKKEGKGKLRDADDSQYQGDFHNDEKHGYGILKYKQRQYKGNFVNNKRKGQGILKLGLGQSYEGQFNDDKMEGKGIFTYSNGDSFEGQFKNNKKDGEGTYIMIKNLKDNIKEKKQEIKGVWKNDIKNGYFVQTKIKEGLVIQGNYTNGQKNGLFTVKYRDSGEKKQDQNWVNGKMIY